MPVVTPEKCRAMYKAARDMGFAYPAINATSSLAALVAVEGFSEAESDGIIQVGGDARHYPVFHGGGGSTIEEIHETLDYGVVKMNIDTDNQCAYTRPVVDPS